MAPKASDTPRKSRDVVSDDGRRARPITSLSFSQIVRFPGFPGASLVYTTKPSSNPWNTSVTEVDTIFQYENCFVIDGKYWVPMTCGTLLYWEY